MSNATGSLFTELRGQARVIAEVRRRVDAWRGFLLGRAAEPYPIEPPQYQPIGDDERPLSPTTMALLHHWFRHEPYILGQGAATRVFKYWPHQRRLVETFIYLYEVCGVRRTEELYKLAGVDPLGAQRDPWAKLGGQLATGSGKTKMMSLIVAWAYLNAVCERESPLGFGRHAILIAPGLFVRDRLFQDFLPSDGGTSVFWSDPVIPPEFESIWDLKVYSSANCPLKLDPAEGALVVTNYHQLLRTSDDAPDLAVRSAADRQLDMLFEEHDPARLEDIGSPLIERFARSRGLLVLNDEAHHVWDETGHAKFEEKAKKGRGSDDEEVARGWIRSIRRLNGSNDRPGRVALQVDLSATLFEETGSIKAKGSKNGATEFRPADLFRHTAVHYGLAEAIQDGIVKKPILERVEVRNLDTGEPEPLIREGAPNAWEKYRNLLVTGIERWKKVKEQLVDEGDPRKPILFILTADRKEAREVANFLSYGEASGEDRSHLTPVGFLDEATGERLFIEPTPEGGVRSTVVEIHIGQKEASNEAEWEKIRHAVNLIDHDEVLDPSGTVGSDGSPRMLRNPYNVVISVMMIREGWDVRNVKVIVPLRACDSRTLTEQTLGRGLRKMHAPVLDDDGAAQFVREDLYVMQHPSFQTILDQIQDIIEERSSDEISHARDYILVEQRDEEEDRRARDVRLVRFQGMVQVVPDWRRFVDATTLAALTPRLGWVERIAEAEIQTYLRAAMEGGETIGQRFAFADNPSYRDFDHVLEAAYALPLLKELRSSYQHKNGVKGLVQAFLERKTFTQPAGMPLSFDRVMEGDDGRIAIGNLARPDVIERVRKALIPVLRAALTQAARREEAQFSERLASELRSYQALRANVLDPVEQTTFIRTALGNRDEQRLARMLDQATDVTGWVYNHQQGVGYSLDYEWRGIGSRYFPDFVVRARLGEVVHNLIVEVKGRLDDKDRAKARQGVRYAELLTAYDCEPWHYLLLIENKGIGREDISWWHAQSTRSAADLLRHHEGLPVFPGESGGVRDKCIIVTDLPEEDRYRVGVPVLDLEAIAGGFSDFQAPTEKGWAHVKTERALDRSMFVARVVGRSMERAIPAGSLALFRRYPAEEVPSPVALDGRRVVVQLRTQADPETGGNYTLKRWRVTRLGPDGEVQEIELRPDNRDFLPMRFTEGDLRVVAEFLEVVG